MDAKLTWKSGLAFKGVANSNIEVPLDASIEHGGGGAGVVPM